MSSRDPRVHATRRRFLCQLAAGAALPRLSIAAPHSRAADGERERLVQLAAEWGGEFGDLRGIHVESEV
jgi:hypothetical protein